MRLVDTSAWIEWLIGSPTGAAEACRVHKLATADAIVFATARMQAASLVTCDPHFEGLPGVTLIQKVRP